MLAPEYQDVPWPLDGYAGLTARVLVSLTRRQVRAYDGGRALNRQMLDDLAQQAEKYLADEALTDDQKREWREMRDTQLPAARERYAAYLAVMCEILKECRVEGFDFRTPDDVEKSLTSDDLPADVQLWLAELPGALIRDRQDALEKKLGRSSSEAPAAS